MIDFDVKIIFHRAYYHLIEKGVNEYLVKKIINKSKNVFKTEIPFKQIYNQSHGEGDLISSHKDYVLEIKLLLTSKFCRKLSNTIIDNRELEKMSNFFIVKSDSSEEQNLLGDDIINYTTYLKQKILRELDKTDVLVFYPLPIHKYYGSSMININTPVEAWLFPLADNKKHHIHLLAPTYENIFSLSNSKGESEFIFDEAFFTTYLTTKKVKTLRINKI